MYFQAPHDDKRAQTRMADEAQFEHDLTQAVGRLRAFARRLARDGDRAEDLVQETCVKALANRHQFAAGTSQRAWMFQILKNIFLSQLRKAKWEVPEEAADESRTGDCIDRQEAHLQLREVQASLMRLPRGQRRAILLVGVHGYSYEEAAEACDCAVGTVKSRVSRARSSLEAAHPDPLDGRQPAGAAD